MTAQNKATAKSAGMVRPIRDRMLLSVELILLSILIFKTHHRSVCPQPPQDFKSPFSAVPAFALQKIGSALRRRCRPPLSPLRSSQEIVFVDLKYMITNVDPRRLGNWKKFQDSLTYVPFCLLTWGLINQNQPDRDPPASPVRFRLIALYSPATWFLELWNLGE